MSQKEEEKTNNQMQEEPTEQKEEKTNDDNQNNEKQTMEVEQPEKQQENSENKEEQQENQEQQKENKEEQSVNKEEQQQEKEEIQENKETQQEIKSRKQSEQEMQEEKTEEQKIVDSQVVEEYSKHAQQLYFVGSAECDQFYIEQEEDVDDDDIVTEQKKPYLQTYFFDKQILINKIICGGMHTVALSTYGDVYTWGCNDDGALGRKTNAGDAEDLKYPERMANKPERVPFPGNYKFNQISAGDSHTCCANTYHNVVYQWGNFRDNKGQMFETKYTPERIGQKEFKGKMVEKIVSGANHLFILASTVLFAWGDPDTSVLGRKPLDRNKESRLLKIESIQRQVKDVWTGAYHGFLLKTKNKRNDQGVLEEVNHYYSWGLNNHGQLGIDSKDESKLFQTEIKAFEGKKIKQIVGGEHHSLAIDESGDIYVWGKNDDGQLGLGETIEDFGIYTKEEIEAMDEEEKKEKYRAVYKPINRGKIQQKNEDDEIISLKTIKLYASTNYSYAFTDNNDYQLYSWGSGDSFVLCTRGESTKYKPWNLFKDKVLQDEDVQQLALGGQHMCYISSDQAEPPALKEDIIKNGIPNDFLEQEKQFFRPTQSLIKSQIQKKTPVEKKMTKSMVVEEDSASKKESSTKKTAATSKKSSRSTTPSKKQSQIKQGGAKKRKGKDDKLDMSDVGKSLSTIKSSKNKAKSTSRSKTPVATKNNKNTKTTKTTKNTKTTKGNKK